MAFITAAVMVAGAAASASAAKKQGDAVQSAANKSAKAQAAFEKEATGKLESLRDSKLADLRSGNIFNEMGGFIFGDQNDNVMRNLRKSQSDNAALASGDTSGFTREVKSIINRSLAETFGGPTGSFENLSSKNLFMLKNQGLANATATTGLFQNIGGALYNFKFGILDSALDKEINLKNQGQQQQAQYAQQAASQEGVGMAALGNTLSAAGQAFSGYQTGQAQKESLAFQQNYQTDYLKYLRDRDVRPNQSLTNYISGGSSYGGNSLGKSNISAGGGDLTGALDLPNYGMPTQQAESTFSGWSGSDSLRAASSPVGATTSFLLRKYLTPQEPPSLLPNIYTNDTNKLPPVGDFPSY